MQWLGKHVSNAFCKTNPFTPSVFSQAHRLKHDFWTFGLQRICKQRAKNQHNVFLNESSVFQKIKHNRFFFFFLRTAAHACFVTASQGSDEKHQQWRSSDFWKAHHFHRALTCSHTKDILWAKPSALNPSNTFQLWVSELLFLFFFFCFFTEQL